VMKLIVTAVLFLSVFIADAQNVIDWDGIYQLKLSDFQSPASEIGDVSVYSIQGSSSFDFSFQMSNAEFMFTKNFNAKVNCSFKRDMAALIAPDSTVAEDLVAFARYEFDLCELYARKLRKRLYDVKGAFSDVNFFRPVYDEIQKEFVTRYTMAGKMTNIGRENERLTSLHAQVLDEIEQLADFCKSCKPPKKKK
jgi:hypothetical protein